MMMVLASVVAALSGAAMGDASLYAGHHMVVVTASTPEQVAALDALGINIACREGLGLQQLIVPPENLGALEALNLPMVTVSEDAAAVIEAEAREITRARDDRDAAFFTTFRQNSEISAFVDDLVAMAPAVATRFHVGTSLENREIYGVKVTGPGGGPKPKVVINGCQHAREWLTPMATCWAAEQLALGYGVDSQITAILDAVEVHIIPVVNPDGYAYTYGPDRYWRKNRRANAGGTFGVDLNRNWSYEYGGASTSTSGSSDVYKGTGPFSEPEAASLAAYITSIAGSTTCIGDCSPGNVCSGLRGHLDIHTASALVLGAWGYSTAVTPPRAELLRAVTDEMTSAIVSAEGYPYIGGLGSDDLLYAASGIAPDWTFAEYGAMAWTYELRPNTGGLAAFSPPASEIMPANVETFAGILALLERVATPTVDIGLTMLPEVVEAPGSAELRVSTAFDECGGTPDGRLYVRPVGGGVFTESALTADGFDFVGSIAPGACGDAVEYYIEIEVPGSGVIARVPSTPGTYVTATSLEVTPVFADAFETNLGWSVSNDAFLSDGAWQRGVPVLPAGLGAPSADQDGSGQCYVTANRTGNADVDGGATTLTSPVLDASDSGSWIEYQRWYDNTRGATPGTDTMLVQVSDDNGGSWHALETIGPGGVGGAENSGGWFFKTFRVADIPSIANTSQFRIRFIAQDPAPGAVVEAAVDAVRLVQYGCSAPACAGDVNGDGFTNSSDFNILASNFGSAVAPGTGGDLTGDGVVNSADFNVLAGDFGCGS